MSQALLCSMRSRTAIKTRAVPSPATDPSTPRGRHPQRPPHQQPQRGPEREKSRAARGVGHKMCSRPVDQQVAKEHHRQRRGEADAQVGPDLRLPDGAIVGSLDQLEDARSDGRADAQREKAEEERAQHAPVEFARAGEQPLQRERLVAARRGRRGSGHGRSDEQQGERAAEEAEADGDPASRRFELAEKLDHRRAVEPGHHLLGARPVAQLAAQEDRDRRRRDGAGDEQRGPEEEQEPPLQRAAQRSAEEARRDHSASSRA